MKEWDRESHKNWTVNQTKREAGMAHVKYFEDREVNIWRHNLVNEQLVAQGEMNGGFVDFEKNL